MIQLTKPGKSLPESPSGEGHKGHFEKAEKKY
jgi:hypothetical protein